MKPNMIKKWSIALLVAAGAAGLTGCEGMRVDEGASSATATNNGNIEDRNVLKATLSGTVVDDFGAGLEEVTVYAYGMETKTDAGGNWMMNDVPVTGININSTPQNLEQTTDVTSNGNLYITYNLADYAQYRSVISNPAVITHYGTAGGNPNSIVVDGLIASTKAQLPKLANTITGILIDRGSYYEDPVGEYDLADGITVRLVPADDLVNGTYGSDAALGNCTVTCGFYSVGEMTATSDNGTFTFNKVPKIPGGYVLRIDNPGYRAVPRPNDGSGFSYDYAGQNWAISTAALDEQNFWSDIDFDVKTASGTITFLEDLYVGDYLVATNNYVEGITTGGKYGNVDNADGEESDDGHNNLTTANDNTIEIDSNLIDLGDLPLKFIFSGDMVPYEAGTLPDRSIVVFDSKGNMLDWESSATSIKDRTLTLQLEKKPTVGTEVYVRLHKDVFIDMSGKRLNQTFDPNQADFSSVAGDADAVGSTYYTEYQIDYVNPLITADKVDDFMQVKGVKLATSALIEVDVLAGGNASNITGLEDDAIGRLDELQDAVYTRIDRERNGGLSGAMNEAAVRNTAVVQFTATNEATYRLRVRDSSGVVLTLADGGGAGTGDETDSGTATYGASATSAAVTVGASTGSRFVDFVATVGQDTDNATAIITISNVTDFSGDTAVGHTATIMRLNDFGDEIATSAVTVELKENVEPHVAIQNSNYNGQDTEVNGAGPVSGLATADSRDTSEVLIEFGIPKTDDAGEAEAGDTLYYFPKLNLTASLYDKSTYRALSETGGSLSIATAAEDSSDVNDNMINNAEKTPLLAINTGSGRFADDTKVGRTATGRSDEFYTTADYNSWLGTIAGNPSCTSYVASITTTGGTSTFNGWFLRDAAGNPTGALINTATLTAIAGYASVTEPSVADTVVNEDSSVTSCGVGAQPGEAETTVVLDMTEPVSAPDNLTTFAAKPGVLSQINIPAGELADNILAITAGTPGFNADHLLVTLEDWRTIDDSKRYQSSAQGAGNLANTEGEGISKTDLMQIVGLVDTDGVAATGGNGQGVVFVDATPPMAISATATDDGGTVSLTIEFDQPITASEVFVAHGYDAPGASRVTYSFGGIAAGATSGTVTRSAAVNDVFASAAGAMATTATYKASASGNTLTVTIADTATTTSNIDYSHFFAAMSHGVSASVDASGSTGTTLGGGNLAAVAVASTGDSDDDPTFFLDYDNIQDTNYNSWSQVEYYDAYVTDGNAGNATPPAGKHGPRLVAVDEMGPQIQAAAASASLDNVFLMEVSDHGLSIISAHGNGAINAGTLQDNDVIYTAGATADSTDVGGATDTAATALSRDYPLYRFWNSADASEATTVDSDNNMTAVRAVINFGATVSERGGGGNAYLQSLLDSGSSATTTHTTTALMRASAALADDGNGAAVAAGGFGISADGKHVVVGIPDYTNGTTAAAADKTSVDADDVLVLDGLVSKGVEYVLHITPPNIADGDAGTTAGNNLGLKVYRKVYLDVALDGLTAEYVTTGADTVAAKAPSFDFLENLSGVTGVSYTAGNTNNTTLTAVDFTESGVVDDGTANQADQIDLSLASPTGTSETAGRYVGDGATVSFTATDFDGATNTYTVVLRLGHNQETALANINDIGNVNPIHNTISSTRNSAKLVRQAP